MTAAELIEEVQKHPPESVVLIWDSYNDDPMILNELHFVRANAECLKVGNFVRAGANEQFTPAIQLK
jgi:hypothetical protein